MSIKATISEAFSCQLGCGACCIAPSISSAIPGMPNGKRAGERCVQLDANNLCLLFEKAPRPQVCMQFQPDARFCGDSATAMVWLSNAERETAPSR